MEQLLLFLMFLSGLGWAMGSPLGKVKTERESDEELNSENFNCFGFSE